MKQTKELLILCWLASIIGLPILGAVNLHRVLSDPAATWSDAGLWSGLPIAGGIAAFVGRGLVFGFGRKSSGGSLPIPSVAPGLADPAVQETRIEIHERNVDVVCVLRGDAANDAEGRRKIGEVASHFAGGVQ